MLSDGRYGAAVRRFAHRYSAFDPARQRTAILDRADELLASDTRSQTPRDASHHLELAAVWLHFDIRTPAKRTQKTRAKAAAMARQGLVGG